MFKKVVNDITEAKYVMLYEDQECRLVWLFELDFEDENINIQITPFRGRYEGYTVDVDIKYSKKKLKEFLNTTPEEILKLFNKNQLVKEINADYDDLDNMKYNRWRDARFIAVDYLPIKRYFDCLIGRITVEEMEKIGEKYRRQ